jgi:putative ABC transport system substrate-binding protein
MPPVALEGRMRRREFFGLVGAWAWAFAAPAIAQPVSRTIRVGVLTPSDAEGRRRSLLQGFESVGYREGQNLVLEIRSADGRLEQLKPLADELTRTNVDVIVSVNTPGTQAAIATTTKIPIVMALVGDPVGSGLVPNLNRPGGNVTGVSNASGETAGKRLALLKQAIPSARRIAVFTHPDDPVRIRQLREVEETSPVLGIETKIFNVVESRDDIERAVAEAVAWKADAVFRVLAQTAPSLLRFQADLLLRHRLPAMLANRMDVVNGGLMSYFADLPEHWNQVAACVDRIVKGAAPGELPVMLPTKFQFVLNIKTAKALGLTLPASTLALADEVIE